MITLMFVAAIGYLMGGVAGIAWSIIGYYLAITLLVALFG